MNKHLIKLAKRGIYSILMPFILSQLIGIQPLYSQTSITKPVIDNNVNNPNTVKIAILHIAPKLGDLSYNISLINSLATKAFENGAKIIVSPELSTTGYCITAAQVLNGLGIKAPFNELNSLKTIAKKYNGYLAIGIAEIGADGNLYNSALLIKPDGNYFLQRKRGLALWNTRGNIPFDVVPTRFGKIGIAICSDTYLMDWVRIMAINGADLILTPANWWGDAGQLNTWTTRAYENGVQMIIANRWGTETDTRFGSPYVYNMNDSPSAIINSGHDNTINPLNQVDLVYRSNEDKNPHDTILYQIVKLNSHKKNHNDTWTLRARQPSAYGEIANLYYRPDLENKPIPTLPKAGVVNVGIMSYQPAADPHKNLEIIGDYWKASNKKVDVLLLPSFGITGALGSPDNSNWYRNYPWKNIQQFVQTNHIRLLVTSFYEKNRFGNINREFAVIVQPGKTMIKVPTIHGWPPVSPTPNPPIYLDIDSARVGLALDHDMLIPETSLDLAKSGADIIIFPFDFGKASFKADQRKSDNWPYNLIETYSNNVCHIVGSNSYGNGVIINNGGGYIKQIIFNYADSSKGLKVIPLDSRTVRTKFLNAYNSFDLSLLESPTKDNMTIASIKKSYQERMVHYKSALLQFESIETSKFDTLARKIANQLFELRRQVLPPGTKLSQ